MPVLTLKAPYPQLDSGERALAEVVSRGETAVLTHRRLVIAGRDGESSTALAHIASLRVRFERLPRAMLGGLVLLAVAAALFSAAGPVRAFFLAQATSLETNVRQEQAQGAAGEAALPSVLSRLAASLAGAARGLPWLGLLAAALGALQLGRGLLGRTVVTVFAGGGELELVRLGRSRPIEDFVKEVGRHLPAPASPR
jgi:hypothetical protein